MMPAARDVEPGSLANGRTIFFTMVWVDENRPSQCSGRTEVRPQNPPEDAAGASHPPGNP
eukprot:scaffold37108_cov23-Cyclotella_meneghiniana.AAC.1